MFSKWYLRYFKFYVFILVIYYAGSAENKTLRQGLLTGDENAELTGEENANLTGDENAELTGEENANLTGDENANLTGDENANLTGDENADMTGDENANLTGDENDNLTGDENKTGEGNDELQTDDEGNVDILTDDENKTGEGNNQDSADGINENLDNNRKDLCRLARNRFPDYKNVVGLKLSDDQFAKFKLWPDATIPFYIDPVSYDRTVRDKITDFLDEVTINTGIIFTELLDPPKEESKRWVLFVNRRGQLECKDYSTNSFTNFGVQKVIIGYNCLPTQKNRGPMSALILALVGVPPQHNAPNRDSYISVSTDAILPDKRGLFTTLKNDDWLFNDLDYDPNSVGHYSSFKYTADGSATIKESESSPYKNMNTDSGIIQEHDYFSCRDILKIKMLYKPLIKRKTGNKCKTVTQKPRVALKLMFGPPGRR